MARKSKGFGELLKQQRGHAAGQKSEQRFAQRIKQSELGKTLEGVVQNPEGVAKMSDVLEAFVEPYTEADMTLNERRNVLGLAVVAWNLALMPLDERQTMMKQFFQEGAVVTDPSVQKEVTLLTNEMIARKQKVFADNPRYIIDFQLEDLGDEFHLSVASSLQK